MKQKYTLIALLGLIGTSCSNQDLEEKFTDVGQVQVTADIAKSRVSFNESNGTTYAYWQTGDAITLSTPTQGNQNYTATVSEDDATAATFAPEAEGLKDIDGESIYASYPATTITDGIVALPATDEWADAKPLPFAYAVSSITDSKVNLTFEHTFAFLKLTLDASPLEYATSTDGDKAIHRLSIKSASETLGIVAGTFNFEDKSINISEGTKEISFTLGKAFNPSEETKRNVYIPILPQSGGTAMTISLLHTYDGGEDILLEMDKQTPAGGFVAGHIYTLTLSGNSSADIEGESGEIHLAVGGTLSTFITAENKNTIKSLKLSGYLNGDDIKLLREMATGNGILTDLDVADATIVEGGGAYYKSLYTQNNVWGDYFFANTDLAKVVLPTNTIAIGNYAFNDCKSLDNVIIPDGVTTIGEYAFYSCDLITNVDIPDAVTQIGDFAFEYCTALKTVSLGKGLTSMGTHTFMNCSALETVSIHEETSLPIIGGQAFWNCTSLTGINIPDNVTTIGTDAFNMCI